MKHKDGQNDVGVMVSKLLQVIGKIPEKLEQFSKASSAVDEEVKEAYSRNTGKFLSQIALEKQMLSDAAKLFSETTNNLRKIGRGASLKNVQLLMLQYYDKFTQDILEEVRKIEKSASGKFSRVYGPVLMLLSPSKLAVIVLDTTMNEILMMGNKNVRIMKVATAIGDIVEVCLLITATFTLCLNILLFTQSEVCSMKATMPSSDLPKWKTDLAKRILQSSKGMRGNKLNSKVMELLGEEKWSNDLKVLYILHLFESYDYHSISCLDADPSGRCSYKYSHSVCEEP